MAFKFTILLACVASVAVGAPQQARIDPRTFDLSLNRVDTTTKTPIPILRYLDQQNPDGSYTYGYESADGTYKIETRYATGEVKGKYGYYDDTGKLREVEYGATPKGGFNPTGEGLVVAPAAPVEAEQPVQPAVAPAPETVNVNGRRANVVRRPRPENGDRRADIAVRRNQQPAQNFVAAQPVTAQPVTAQPVARARPAIRPAAQPAFQPVQPVLNAAERFAGHPAQNIDLNTGSYSIHYSGR